MLYTMFTNLQMFTVNKWYSGITSLTLSVCMNDTYFVKITLLGLLHCLHWLLAWHLQNVQQWAFLSVQGQERVAHFTQLHFRDTSSGKLRWYFFETRHWLSMVNPYSCGFREKSPRQLTCNSVWQHKQHEELFGCQPLHGRCQGLGVETLLHSLSTVWVLMFHRPLSD